MCSLVSNVFVVVLVGFCCVGMVVLFVCVFCWHVSYVCAFVLVCLLLFSFGVSLFVYGGARSLSSL